MRELWTGRSLSPQLVAAAASRFIPPLLPFIPLLLGCCVQSNVAHNARHGITAQAAVNEIAALKRALSLRRGVMGLGIVLDRQQVRNKFVIITQP